MCVLFGNDPPSLLRWKGEEERGDLIYVFIV